jgi:hypothetical protein
MHLARRAPAAQRDTDQDRQPASQLARSCRVPEYDDARDRSDHRLDVHEGAGDLSGNSLLSVGEQGERRHGPCHRQGQRGQDRDESSPRRNCDAAGTYGNRQHASGRTQELYGGDRRGVASAQQAGLGDHERRRQQDGGENEPVAYGRCGTRYVRCG